VRLALDHHYSPLIAAAMRERGYDVHAAVELGWQSEADEQLLVLCTGEGRALVSNNVSDFMLIARRWTDEGLVHSGLVFTSDSGWPRRRDTIGRYVDALADFMDAHPADDGLADRVKWL
jgi:hypothetical protein